MKDDIKIDPNTKPTPQFRGPQSAPPKTVDGISPNPEPNPVINKQPNPQVAPKTETTVEAPLKTSQSTQAENSQPPQALNKPKSRRSVLPVIIAIIFLLALSSLAVYIGVIKPDESASSQKGVDSQPNNQQPAAESRQEIEQAIKQIDDLPAKQDSSGDNLSDQQLGL